MKKFFAVLLIFVLSLMPMSGNSAFRSEVFADDEPSQASGLIVGERAKGYMEWQGIPRMFEYYIPTTYDGKRMPLMFTIHGSGTNSAMTVDDLGKFQELAEREGFILVAPNAVMWLPHNYQDWVDKDGNEIYADAFLPSADGTAGPYTYEVNGVQGAYVNGSAGYTSYLTVAMKIKEGVDPNPDGLSYVPGQYPPQEVLNGESISAWLQEVTLGTERVNKLGVDDEGYFCALVDEFIDKGVVDKNRVFLSGISQGGFMSLRLAALHADKFAGAGIVSGELTASVLSQVTDDTPTDLVKLVFFHGDKDRTVPSGAYVTFNPPVFSRTQGPHPWGSAFLTLNETIQWFLDREGLTMDDPQGVPLPHKDVMVSDYGSDELYPDPTDIVRYEYNGGAAVTYWVLNGGHTWPGGAQYGPVETGPGQASMQASASELMWNDLKIELIDEIPEVSVRELGGENIELKISITKVYDNGKQDVVAKTFIAGASAAGLYKVDDYIVFARTKDGRVRESYIAGTGDANVPVPGNKTELDNLYSVWKLILNAGKAQGNYTDGSWAAFSSAMSGAADTLAINNASQEDVDLAYGVLAASIAKLKTAKQLSLAISLLESAVDFGVSGETAYTSATWEVYENALHVAQAMLLAPENYTYDNLIAGYQVLVQATQGLEYSLTESLRNLLAYYIACAENDFLANEDQYIPIAVENLKEKLAEAKAVLDDSGATQNAIKAATDALLDAIKQMHEKADKSTLLELTGIANGANYAEMTYTPATWLVLSNALMKAETILANENAISSQVLEAYDALFAAMMGLTVRANFAGLEALIAQAQIILAHSEDYVESTLSGLAEETALALTVFNNKNSTRVQIAATQAALMAKVMNARLKADMSSILNALGIVSGMNLNVYTPQSVQPLSALIAEAEAMLSQGTFTSSDQGRIDALAERILRAINVLVRETGASGTMNGGIIASAVSGAGTAVDISAAGDVGSIANGEHITPPATIERSDVPLAGSPDVQSNVKMLSWVAACMALIILGLIFMLLKKRRVENRQTNE